MGYVDGVLPDGDVHPSAASAMAARPPWPRPSRRPAAHLSSIRPVGEDSENLFDKASADALLPELRRLIARLREVAGSDAARAAQRRLAQAGRANGSPAAAAAAFEAAASIQSVVAEIEELGVILRDPATGLCDFPAEREGEPVYLCWRPEEEEVSWWHPRDTGFSGRLPL